jgi:hypothetical protein
MSELFDMVAGTSTGSILSMALAAPKQGDITKPAFYASDIYDFYINKGPEIFKATSINKGLLVICILAATLIGGFLGFRAGKRIFADPQMENTHRMIRDYIKECKKTAKGGPHDEKKPNSMDNTTASGVPVGANILQALTHSIKKKYDLHFEKVRNGEEIKEKCESQDYWQIKEAERILNESEIKYKESKDKKWIIMSIGLVLGAVLGYYVPIGVYKVTRSTYDRDVFDRLLVDMFGNYTIDDAITDEVMAIAYSFNA